MGPASRSCFSCPVCTAAFVVADSSSDDARTWRCPTGHAFDVAKDGSVHLLPAGHGQTRVVGDTGEMLLARRRFLSAGHYHPLTEAIADAVVAVVGDSADVVIADLGCGEGSHLTGVIDRLDAAGVTGDVVGVDLAKEAIRLAARGEKRARFVVGDTRTRIPLVDGSVDAAIVAFAPRSAAELSRVVKPGGAVVVAMPEPGHLASLVTRFGGIGLADDKRERLGSDLGGDFIVDTDTVVRHVLVLSGPALVELIGMTPHARHVSPASLAEAAAMTMFETVLCARVVTARRRGSD